MRTSFADSYRRSIALNAKSNLVFYSSNGTKTVRTFAEFNADVEQVRMKLRPLRKTARVAALIDRNSYLQATYSVASLLEGFSLCPIDPADGAELIGNKIRQLDEPVVIFWRDEVSGLPGHRMDLSQDDVFHELMNASFSPDQPFVLIFTSGSTGHSKIVEQMESQVMTNVEALIRLHAMNNSFRIGTPLPLFHVNALEFSFFCSILSGAHLTIFEKFDLHQVESAIATEHLQVLSLVPHLIRVLCDRQTAAIKSLRYVVTAAAPLSTAVAKRFVETFQIPLIQGYGLSEAVNFSALMPPSLTFEENKYWLTNFEKPSIGMAVQGNEISILREDNQPAGEGESGELCIRGENVMRGYRGDKIRDVFRDGFLRTGDLGFFRLKQNGEKYFFINGRIKDVAKRYGNTIPIAEIDQMLIEKVGGELIVVPFDHDLAGDEIGVMLQMAEPDDDKLKRVKAILEKEIPSHYRPRVIAWTRESVRTPSGKPMRWKFKSVFSSYSGKIFGESVLLA